MTTNKKRLSGSLVDAFGAAFGKYLEATKADTRKARAAAMAAHEKALAGGETLATLYDWANEIGDRIMQDCWLEERGRFWMPPVPGKKVSR